MDYRLVLPLFTQSAFAPTAGGQLSDDMLNTSLGVTT